MRLDPAHKQEDDGRCDLEALMRASGATVPFSEEYQLTGLSKKTLVLDPYWLIRRVGEDLHVFLNYG
jgi:hypothetical protein